MSDAAKVAEKFHETRRTLASAFDRLGGYDLAWGALDQPERDLMTAVVAHLIGTGVIVATPPSTWTS